MDLRAKGAMIDKICAVWADTPERDVCIAVFEYLLKNYTAKTLFLSDFLLVGRSAGIDETNVLLASIAYLCGGDMHLIEMRYEYYDNQDSDLPAVIEVDRLQAAAALKRSINPISGEVEDGVADRIMTHYRPTRELIAIATAGLNDA